MALLAHIYGQKYSYAEGSDSLQKLALLFVAAEKYQLSELQGILYGRLNRTIESQHFDPEDFYNAVRTIFTLTGQDSRARSPVLSGCVHHLGEFRQDSDFVSLLNEFPDLSVAILTSHELACAFPGDWVCEHGYAEEYILCDGVSTCSYRDVEIGKEPSACGYEFTRLFAWKHHNIMNWLCPSCGNLTRPRCSGCQGHGTWGRRCFGRVFS